MEYKMYKVGSYNIHTIKTDKFKTIKMDIIFRNNFDPKTSALRSLVFDVLTENTKKYNTRRKLCLKYESLYNAYSTMDTTLLGRMLITDFSIEFINPKYTGENYLEEVFSLQFETIFNPNITNGEFDLKTVELCKKRLIDRIDSVKENPSRYSILKALKALDPNSLTSHSILEDKDQIENATNEMLISTYNDIIKHDYIDIFIIGEFDENKIIDLINKYAKFDTIKNHKIEIYNENKTRRIAKKKKEKSENSQSQLVVIYNTLNLNDYEMNYVLPIYNMVFGSSSLETKLYKNLRTDNSLCYGLTSFYQRYDNLLIVLTSLDKKNENVALKLIDKSFNEMGSNITDEEVKRAIDLKITSLNMINDYPAKILETHLFKYLNLAPSVDEMIKKFGDVTKEDLFHVHKKIKKNITYILTSGGESDE